ncbi:hypothetical protein HU200_029203 [Digitaria exilis]|uniref:Uncharacterized protein n=1 Tax=Digitaria exilis TaxID=1010633 RepID=A0A835BQI4_9POAL|nr:hypothetical protein HU200_029203 [Digitaria exilis]
MERSSSYGELGTINYAIVAYDGSVVVSLVYERSSCSKGRATTRRALDPLRRCTRGKPVPAKNPLPNRAAMVSGGRIFKYNDEIKLQEHQIELQKSIIDSHENRIE